PLHRLQRAEGEIVKLGVDDGELRRAAAGSIQDEDVAHRAPFDRAIRETPAVGAEAERVVYGFAGDDSLGVTIERHAHDRLLEHVLTRREWTVVRNHVDRFAVAGPGEVVDPGVIAYNHPARTAAGGHDCQPARRHDVGLSVRGDE